MIAWITGRPASGKTTLGRRVVAALEGAITPTPRYTAEERAIVYRAIAYVARRLDEQGVIAVVAATAHHPALRAAAREVCGPMLLVFARCPAEVCEARDPKGLYRRARAAAQGTMPGVHESWIDPEDADAVVDTDREVDDATVRAIAARVSA
ncbi:MAG: adenylyl-sulfate kinase [Deltaproteobacteria bacterium]|nr:adenylyl-sulfate kinase [Deltaproteobacteria bacterium]